MSGLDWQAPDFLSNTSGDDYLASLASFLDGPNGKYSSTAIPQLPDLSVYNNGIPTLGGSPSSPELTSDSGASPSSSNEGNQQSRRSTASGDQTLSSHHQPQTVGGLHDKRKNGAATTQAIKDRRSSSGTGKQTATHHSHPEGIDGDIARSASPEDEEDGKRGGKKTSEKRKAQNRQAQRNFRERKEKHLKDLEDKVGALEQRANDTDAENSALKQLLQQLKSENERLKVYESAFSFSYDKDVNNSSTMPTSSTFQGGRSSQPPTSTSPLSLDESNTSFSFDNSSFELPVSHPSSSNPSYSSTTSIPDFSTTSTAAGIFPDSIFLNSLTAPPSSGGPSAVSAGNSPISPSTIASASSITTPPSSTAPDLFASYRDPLADLSLPSAPLATLADFDLLFASSSNSSSAGQSPAAAASIDPFKQFMKSPSPLNNNGLLQLPSSTEGKEKVEFVGEANCPYGLKEGEKYQFDLDSLCHEMKLKATCQEAARQALKSAMAEDALISPQDIKPNTTTPY